MKRRNFLEQWGLSSLKIGLRFLEGEFAPRGTDHAAAWELYIELLTRVTTQHLAPEDRDEKTALDSCACDLFTDARNLKAARLRLGRTRQAGHPGAQTEHSSVHGSLDTSSCRSALQIADRCSDFRAKLAAL